VLGLMIKPDWSTIATVNHTLAISKQANDSQRKQSDRGHKTQYFIIQTSYNQRLHSNCQTKERNPNLKSLLL